MGFIKALAPGRTLGEERKRKPDYEIKVTNRTQTWSLSMLSVQELRVEVNDSIRGLIVSWR